MTMNRKSHSGCFRSLRLTPLEYLKFVFSQIRQVVFAEHAKPAIALQRVVKHQQKFAKMLSLPAYLKNDNSALDVLFATFDHHKRPCLHRYIVSTRCKRVRSGARS
jgi:hypothetical protein